MNILYINDPTCVHGFKWISYFSNQTDKYKCFLIGQQHQDKKLDNLTRKKLSDNHIEYLPPVFEFSVTRVPRTIKDFQYIKQILIEKKINLIHIMYAEPSALWGLGRNYFNVPMVLTTRGTDVLITIPNLIQRKHPFYYLLKKLFIKSFNNIDFITHTSSPQQQIVLKLFTPLINKTAIIRTGINIDLIKKDTKDYALDLLKDRAYIFFPRNMTPLYNHELTLDAIELLPQKISDCYNFVFLHKNGTSIEYIEMIKNRMDTIQNAKFIFLEDYTQETIFEIFKNASLVVMNPKSDGSPVTALEAMYLEIPVILGPLAYDKDLFDDTTFQIKKWDAKELADLITYVLENKNEEYIQNLIRNAKLRVKDKANTIKEVKKIEEIYKKLT